MAEILKVSEYFVAASVVLATLLSPGFLSLALWTILQSAVLSLVCGIIGVRLLILSSKFASKLSGIFLCLIPLFTYQPVFALTTGLIFFGLSLKQYIVSPSKKISRNNMTLIGIFFSGLLLNLYLITNLGDSSQSRGNIVRDIEGKFFWLRNELIPGLWRVNPWGTNVYLIYTLVFLSLTGLIFILIALKSISARLMLLVALPLSLTPNLLSAENWASNRSLLAPQWLLLLLASLSLFKFLTLARFGARRAVPILLVCSITVCFAQVQFLGVQGWKEPLLKEQELVDSALTIQKCEKLRYVKSSNLEDSLISKMSYDEFGRPTSYAEWAVVPFVKFICSQKTKIVTEPLLVTEMPEGLEDPDLFLDLHLVLRGL